MSGNVLCMELIQLGQSPTACSDNAHIVHPVQLSLEGCARQTALERQDLSRTYLAHHELESVVMLIVNILLLQVSQWRSLLKLSLGLL